MKSIFAAELISKIINFGLLPVFLLSMTDAEFSDFTIAMTIVMLLSMMFGGGIFQIYASEVANCNNERVIQSLSRAYTTWFLASMTFLLIFLAFMVNFTAYDLFYSKELDLHYILLVIVISTFSNLNTLLYVMAQMNCEWLTLCYIILVKNIFPTILASVLLYFDLFSVDGTLLRLIVILCMEFIITIALINKFLNFFKLKNPLTPLNKEDYYVLSRLKYILPMTILSGCIPFSERLAVSTIYTASDFKVYAIALQILSPLGLLIGAMAQVRIHFFMSALTTRKEIIKYLTFLVLLSLIFIVIVFGLLTIFIDLNSTVVAIRDTCLLISSLFVAQLVLQNLSTRLVGLNFEHFLVYAYAIILIFFIAIPQITGSIGFFVLSGSLVYIFLIVTLMVKQ